MSQGMDWEQIVAFVRSVIPAFVGFTIALIFCLIRRRENPRGAAFLGLAVLLSCGRITVNFICYYFMQPIIGFLGPEGFQYTLFGIQAVGSLAFWCLIVMAVFARPKHYYNGSPSESLNL